MNISGIETKNKNYAVSNVRTKSSDRANASDSFQHELVDWEKKVKESIDKQQANDKSGNILMSEKRWRTFMKKVDSAIDAFESEIKEEEEKAKKQAEVKNSAPKDTANVNTQPHKVDNQLII